MASLATPLPAIQGSPKRLKNARECNVQRKTLSRPAQPSKRRLTPIVLTAPPWSILTWHSYARYIEHRVKRCAYVLLNGNGNGTRAAVKSFEKISEIFG